MRLATLTLLVMGCGGATTSSSPPSAASAPASARARARARVRPSASAPAPAPASASASASAPAPAPAKPPATGGSVLIGEIAAPKAFDPKPTVVSLQPQLLACYNQARADTPGLHGKLKVRVVVNEAGTVINVDEEPGGTASNAEMLSCISSATRVVHFPKPAGTATIVVPLVFRP